MSLFLPEGGGRGERKETKEGRGRREKGDILKCFQRGRVERARKREKERMEWMGEQRTANKEGRDNERIDTDGKKDKKENEIEKERRRERKKEKKNNNKKEKKKRKKKS